MKWRCCRRLSCPGRTKRSSHVAFLEPQSLKWLLSIKVKAFRASACFKGGGGGRLFKLLFFCCQPQSERGQSGSSHNPRLCSHLLHFTAVSRNADVATSSRPPAGEFRRISRFCRREIFLLRHISARMFFFFFKGFFHMVSRRVAAASLAAGLKMLQRRSRTLTPPPPAPPQQGSACLHPRRRSVGMCFRRLS